MRVKATAQGYLDGFREVGDEFDAPDDAKGPWFYPLERPAATEEDQHVELARKSRKPKYT
jgi:hypothetical protein